MSSLRVLPSPNQDDRPEGAAVNAVILHYTGMPTGAAALAWLRDPLARVSAHWLIEEDGGLVALVPEGRRAWHAGISAWGDLVGLNQASIGIELVHPGHEWGYRGFADRQVARLIRLLQGIRRRFAVPRARILSHAEIAPHRKEDPGELFPWETLAAAGVALGLAEVAAAPAATGELDALLAEIGHPFMLDGVTLEQVVRAFQRRWRQERVDGVLDPETADRVRRLVGLLRSGASC